RRGWKVSGFDANGASLHFARQRLAETGLKARLWQDRLESFAPPPGASYDLVHCLVSTFKYLTNESDARECLRRAGHCLRPGGLLIVGLHLTDYSRTRPEHERWVAAREGIEVVCNTRTFPPDRQRRTEALRCRLRVTENGKAREQETHWNFRTYDAGQFRKTLRTALPGFRLVDCHDFHHDPEFTRQFDDEYSDLVVVMKKDAI
ncbi:MAG: class I SAM-dependent methyltransferase, partial [Verrucomicrobiae bacterium]|nr:class I SAM-dependent methyltransferase [Verrucomicrobiae bacterium]